MFKRRVLSGLAAICFASLATLGSAQAESGVALVIGNSAYKNAQPLTTVYADADATAQTLQSAGFDVTEYHDVAQADTGAVMRDFLTKVQSAGPDTVAFLYLSGYATQFNGDDYFVPSDAKIDKDTDIPGEALRVADVTDELAKLTTRAAVVVIDGSRANAFGQAGGAPPAQGLAMVSAPQGMLIAYAAQPGAVAPDGDGPYSLFAGTLNTVMREPGHTLDEIFKVVRLNVAQATNEAQTPWSASALTSDVQVVRGCRDAGERGRSHSAIARARAAQRRRRRPPRSPRPRRTRTRSARSAETPRCKRRSRKTR